MVAIVDAQPGALVVQRQGFRDAIRQLVATLRRQDRRGERPAALDLGLGQVAAADLMRQALQGEQLAAVEGEVGEILRQLARAAQFRRRLDLAALGEQYAAALAAPGTVVAVGHQQAAALALGSQPEALALGVDGDPSNNALKFISMPLARACGSRPGGRRSQFGAPLTGSCRTAACASLTR